MNQHDQLFVALLVYKSSSTASGYLPLYEETVTLVSASSADSAKERARELAESRQTTFANEFGETIVWSLERVVDVTQAPDTLGDGVEIYTRHFRDYNAYLAFETMTPQE